MIALCLSDAEIMIARRILRSLKWVMGVRPSRACIPPPKPSPTYYSAVVIPANIPMRDIGSARQILANDANKTAADTVKPESNR